MHLLASIIYTSKSSYFIPQICLKMDLYSCFSYIADMFVRKNILIRKEINIILMLAVGGMQMGGFPFWMDMESPDSPGESARG